MKYRIWEIKQECFDVLLNHVGFNEKMKDALRDRYESNCCLSRPIVCALHRVSEHGLMKAEKKVLKAHEEIYDVYRK